jgi:hypothetical protein
MPVWSELSIIYFVLCFDTNEECTKESLQTCMFAKYILFLKNQHMRCQKNSNLKPCVSSLREVD